VSTTSKSPLNVAEQALAVGTNAFPLYAHRYSPKLYTQPQLFACLVLKTFCKTDYRGIAQLLRDFSDLRRVLGLERVPHFTTLQKASGRLLCQPHARRILRGTVRRFFGRRRRSRRVALDSSGFDCGHASRYFIRRRSRTDKPWKTVVYSRYAKLELSVDCESHFIVGVLTSRGPRVDVDRFAPLLDATLPNIRPQRVVADAGYDSEPNHRYARDLHGILSFMPATLGRPTTKLPSGRHRRRMKQRLNKSYGGYGQRWQGETAISMIKRRSAVAVYARTYWSQSRELWLLALTHNVMILYVLTGFLQSMSATFSLGDPEAAKLLKEARRVGAPAPLEVPDLLRDAKKPLFYRANLTLAYAKALSNRRVYEEALDALNNVKAEQVVDPASYLFHKAVSEHALTDRLAANTTIIRLLDDVADAPERYKMVSALMVYDMLGWQEKDLGWVSRKMDNIERRLELARGGPTTQKMQKQVVARLDEMIKELENQGKGAGS
jgi:Transposase DDE domain